jgi:serine/threonine protein kinase
MQRIGRYQVVGELGRGAMGVVYRALDPSIGRTVAIKTIRLADLTEPTERSRLRERLFREAQSAGMLSHPNIVTIYDVGEEEGVAYIAMEFVDGPTLDRLAHTEPLTGARVLEILAQAAAALDYAHKRGIVHRDIKPANIMMHEKSVKIADFGIARIQSQQMTHAGGILGTPSYMSPEQVQGHTIDGRADQFSLAVIAFELMTGEKPFSGDSMTALLYKIVRDDPPSPQRLNPSLSWPVETVLKRAMAKDPGERYASCSDFAKALENATHSAKGWAPLPPGGSHNMPTMMDARKEAAAAMAVPVPVPGADSKSSFGWKLLRVMRVLAVVILSAGVASFLMVLGYNYWVQRNEKPMPETTQVETPPPVVAEKPKPSPSEIPVINAPVTPKQDTPPPGEPTQAKQERPTPDLERITAPPDGALTARLVTNPPGATAIVDSRPEMMCKTPCSLNLANGRHTLAVQLQGYRNALRIFTLPQDAEVLVVLDAAKGTLMIKSNPSGGTILIDGQIRPEKTPAMIVVPAGTHKIEVQETGYAPFIEEVTLRDNGVTNIEVNWPSKIQP